MTLLKVKKPHQPRKTSILHWARKNPNKPNFQLNVILVMAEAPPMGTTQIKTLPSKSVMTPAVVLVSFFFGEKLTLEFT